MKKINKYKSINIDIIIHLPEAIKGVLLATMILSNAAKNETTHKLA